MSTQLAGVLSTSAMLIPLALAGSVPKRGLSVSDVAIQMALRRPRMAGGRCIRDAHDVVGVD